MSQRHQSKKMKTKVITTLLLVVLVLSCTLSLFACQGNKAEQIDYVSQLKFDINSTETLKQKVTVHTYIDGDTTHFNVPTSISSTGVLKARYLAVNTPESTGKIEPYGKKASNFTKNKLKSANEIYIESNDNKWNLDKTGARYLVWVWYNTSEDSTFRLLNLELLQNGLAVESNILSGRYGETCYSALEQAKNFKLSVWSGEADPDYFYGKAIQCTLKDIRLSIADYEGSVVAFEATVARQDGDTIYVEDYDEETGRWYGMQVYSGNSGIGSMGTKIVSTMGNRILVVGAVQYWESGATYQISGIKYDPFPDPGTEKEYISLISSGNEISYTTVTADQFASKVDVEINDETKQYDFAELALYTTVEIKGLTVDSVYTTESGSSMGAMTLTCSKDGKKISVRTNVLYKDGIIVEADYFEGKTIDVKGVVGYYKSENSETGKYQIMLLTLGDATIVE